MHPPQWLVLLSLLASVPAQYCGSAPLIIDAPGTNPGLGANGLGNGVTRVGQILLVPHASLPTGTYYLAATVLRTGGAGGWDAMTGTYNRLTGTFTKDTAVDPFNTAGDEFAASVSGDLRTFCMDTAGGATPMMWATRAGTTGNFTRMGSVTGVPIGYIDPNFCRIGSQLSLLLVSGPDLAVGDFNAGTVSNVRRIVTNPIGAGSHSPSPMNNEFGETRSLLFSAQVPGRASNAWFSPSVDDSEPSFQILDTPTWLANPDANGGTCTYAEAGTVYGDPASFGILAVSAGRIVNGELSVTAFVPQRNPSSVPFFVALAIERTNSSGGSIDLGRYLGMTQQYGSRRTYISVSWHPNSGPGVDLTLSTRDRFYAARARTDVL